MRPQSQELPPKRWTGTPEQWIEYCRSREQSVDDYFAQIMQDSTPLQLNEKGEMVFDMKINPNSGVGEPVPKTLAQRFFSQKP